MNYRLFGDQISLAGTPIGTTVTLTDGKNFNLIGLEPNGIASTPSIAAANFIANLPLGILTIHFIATLLPILDENGPAYAGGGVEPNDVLAIEDFLAPTSATAADGTVSQDFDNLPVTVEDEELFDPAGSDILLTGQAGSPDFASVDLPAVSGVS